MSLNHTPAVQNQTPPLISQNLGNAGPSASAVKVQQSFQEATITTQTGGFNEQFSSAKTDYTYAHFHTASELYTF